MKNYEIRRLIESEVQSRGRVDTRLLIAQLANRLKIPKQKKNMRKPQMHDIR